MEPRVRAGEKGCSMTEHDGVEVEPVGIDQPQFGQASRKPGTAHLDLSIEFGPHPADHRRDVIPDERGVGADRIQRARHDHFG